MPVWPKLRHVVTCLRCGYREAFTLLNSYPDRCPHSGHELEHDIHPFDDGLELRAVRTEPRPLWTRWLSR